MNPKDGKHLCPAHILPYNESQHISRNQDLMHIILELQSESSTLHDTKIEPLDLLNAIKLREVREYSYLLSRSTGASQGRPIDKTLSKDKSSLPSKKTGVLLVRIRQEVLR